VYRRDGCKKEMSQGRQTCSTKTASRSFASGAIAFDEEAPYTDVDQRHLDAHTPERAYWHHGYQAALNDIMALIALEGGKTGTAGIPN
jgi:hypothetical protein